MHSIRAFLALPVLVVACSSSSNEGAAPTPSNDASVDTAVDTAVAPLDAQSDAAIDAPVLDAPATETSDAGACEDLSGAYALTGTCSVDGFTPFPSACVSQKGCDATIAVSVGTLPGKVVGNQVKFSSSVAGTPLDCTATIKAGALEVHCEAAGGAVTCDATGSRTSFPGASRYCCDVKVQDCGDGKRCNIVGDDAKSTNSVTACIPAGTIAKDTACTRDMGRVGADQCAKGLFCANFGQVVPDTRVCQTLCRHTGDCEPSAVCVGVGNGRAGVCRPKCAFKGTDCGAGTTCKGTHTWGATDPTTSPAVFSTICTAIGAVADGGTCTANTDCGLDLACGRATASDPQTCHPACDSTHACAGGKTCTPFNSTTNPTGLGFCTP